MDTDLRSSLVIPDVTPGICGKQCKFWKSLQGSALAIPDAYGTSIACILATLLILALTHHTPWQGLTLSRRLAPGLFFGFFFLPCQWQNLGHADVDSANCRIICSPQNIVKTFPKDFHFPLFCARWNSVLHGNQAVGIGSRITVESSGGAARCTIDAQSLISSCTIESPLQSR